MAGGFNHNFRYQGELYHAQTEDSGVRSARIVTLIFRGGTIVASEKYSYADLIGREDLPLLVEERMKAQHGEMMQRLKDGEFDDAIAQQFPDAQGEDPAGTTEGEPRLSESDLEELVFAYLTVNDDRY